MEKLILSENCPNFSNRIGSWLRGSLAIAKSVSSDVTTELSALSDYWRSPSFSLAFVGEFCRGKSTLLNRLLERDLLPTGSTMPTTATLTSIVSGGSEHLKVLFPNGRREIRSLEESSWKDLLATDTIGNDRVFTAEVQLTLNDPWLKNIDVELIDTPGVGDLCSYRSALISKFLGQCDAAVLVVSATLPFSQTEAAFLEEEVIGRHIPRILVVVSKLDNIDHEKRAIVFSAICTRVSKISSEISVVPLHPLEEHITDDEALENVRSHIETLIGHESRRAWRSQKVAQQIFDSLSQLEELSQINLRAIQMSAIEREKALQQLQAEISQADLEWDRIELELTDRRQQYEQKLRQDLSQAKTELLQFFGNQIKEKEDLKLWWENTFNNDLRIQLAALDRKFNDSILASFHSDAEWLYTEVKQIFAIKSAKKNVKSSLDETEIKPELRQVQLANVKHFWSLAGNGATGAVVGITGLMASPLLSYGAAEGAAIAITATGAAMAIPLVIVGVAATEGIKFLLKQRLQKSIKQQQDLLIQELERAFDKMLDRYRRNASNHLRDLYQQLIEHTKQVQANWYSAKESAFKVNELEANNTNWQQCLTQVSVLKQEIITVLNNRTT
ncbi:MAG: dynamin family protein [Prochloraceae cyanobacterium]|nr:dynamin family protein [Prochloraceae cyanobacterium]